MKTRSTLSCHALVLGLSLFFMSPSGVSAEEPGPASFLKVGSTYNLSYTPATVRVKILEHVGAQWFRVEVRQGANKKPAVRWINFANVHSVAEAEESPTKAPEKQESDKNEPEKK